MPMPLPAVSAVKKAGIIKQTRSFMAIRMQQRRGLAEQWLLADPVLVSGEIGFETDT
jgi:hypothetical protein